MTCRKRDTNTFLFEGGEDITGKFKSHVVVVFCFAPSANVKIEGGVAKTREENHWGGVGDEEGMAVDDAENDLTDMFNIAVIIDAKVKIAAAEGIAGDVDDGGFDDGFAGDAHAGVVSLAQGDGEEVNGFDGALDVVGADVVTEADTAFAHDEDTADEVAEGCLSSKADGDTSNAGCT